MLLVAGFVLAFSDTAESCFEPSVSVEVFCGTTFSETVASFFWGGLHVLSYVDRLECWFDS